MSNLYVYNLYICRRGKKKRKGGLVLYKKSLVRT
jgi:hypothetical protein